jgi:hypothetical protein
LNDNDGVSVSVDSAEVSASLAAAFEESSAHPVHLSAGGHRVVVLSETGFSALCDALEAAEDEAAILYNALHPEETRTLEEVRRELAI